MASFILAQGIVKQVPYYQWEKWWHKARQSDWLIKESHYHGTVVRTTFRATPVKFRGEFMHFVSSVRQIRGRLDLVGPHSQHTATMEEALVMHELLFEHVNHATFEDYIQEQV